VTSAGAWINFILLFIILYVRGHFRMPAWLVNRVARQMVAALVMAAALLGVRSILGDWFFGGAIERAIALIALVGIGGLVYFGVAFLIGGVDRDAIASLRRRRAPE
jgi:putative peptidoglycan lipid II flippase